MRTEHEVAVIGGGPAGLATAAELRRVGIEARIFERGERVGWCWRSLYDSLRLHTGKHLSCLPGLPFPASAPLFPHRDEFLAYLEGYADRFELDVTTGHEVRSLVPADRGWRLQLRSSGAELEVRARRVVVATGILSNPWWPRFENAGLYLGTLAHSVLYREPSALRGQRVLVVGCGNSAAEIATELAAADVAVELSVRSGAHVLPRCVLGVPIQYLAYANLKLPRPAGRWLATAFGYSAGLLRGRPVLPRPVGSPLDSIPVIGLRILSAIREGRIKLRPAIVDLCREGACFADGERGAYDSILLATGFRPALALLRRWIRRDRRGFAERRDRVTSADRGGLYFVGHNYDSTGGLCNIRRDARLVARRLKGEVSCPRPL